MFFQFTFIAFTLLYHMLKMTDSTSDKANFKCDLILLTTANTSVDLQYLEENHDGWKLFVQSRQLTEIICVLGIWKI
jgi:hypothetical protein